MTIYFVSSADGSDGDNGTTLDLAWATLKHALENGVLVAGDAVAIRRTHSEIPAADIAPVDDGTAGDPIKVFCCPRAALALSDSSWTNGSTTVTVATEVMVRAEHQARYVTAPNGLKYLITRVASTTSIRIDREYVGSTSANDATASIDADTVQSDWDAYDDTSDTIKQSGWDSDTDALPIIDFNDQNFQLNVNGDQFHNIYCIEFKDSADSNGIVLLIARWSFEGCLIKQSTQNAPLVRNNFAECSLKRCVIEGSGSGTSQRGVYNNSGTVFLEDVSIYNMGDSGLYQPGGLSELKNVDIGIEQANGDDDITNAGGIVTGVDVRLDGTSGLVNIDSSGRVDGMVSIENYQKVLGDHRTFYGGGYYERSAVSGETPDKKVSDYVLKITPNVNVTPIPDLAFDVLVHEIDGVTTGSKTFKYWIYNDTGVTLNDTTALDDIWLKAEYIDSFDDTTEYTRLEAFSAEIDILDAASASDWDSLSVTLTPATASKVRLTIFISYYNASTTLFIDPAVVIT